MDAAIFCHQWLWLNYFVVLKAVLRGVHCSCLALCNFTTYIIVTVTRS